MKTDNAKLIIFLLSQLVTFHTAFAADMQPPTTAHAPMTPNGEHAPQGESRLLCNQARPRVPMPGAPNASDVIMRALRLCPINQDDKRDTMQALRDFHATTLAWAYIDNPGFIAKVKQSGRVFGGAASAPSYVGSKEGDDWLSNLAILDRRGEVIIAPWKRTWKPTLWGCLNNPELERGYLACLKRYVDAGAQIMQRDEPGGNKSAVSWGGCFCEHCMRGFRDYLANHTTPEQREQLGVVRLEDFDYRTHLDSVDAPVGDAFGRWDGGRVKELFLAFQTETTVEFHRRARAALDAHAGRRVPLSCNNGVRH